MYLIALLNGPWTKIWLIKYSIEYRSTAWGKSTTLSYFVLRCLSSIPVLFLGNGETWHNPPHYNRAFCEFNNSVHYFILMKNSLISRLSVNTSNRAK